MWLDGAELENTKCGSNNGTHQRTEEVLFVTTALAWPFWIREPSRAKVSASTMAMWWSADVGTSFFILAGSLSRTPVDEGNAPLILLSCPDCSVATWESFGLATSDSRHHAKSEKPCLSSHVESQGVCLSFRATHCEKQRNHLRKHICTF